ncbi:type I-E CRISPR-associated protein Cas6/Cse3/CasE [Dermacoccaceae bacterium W4C1]
MYLSEIRLNSTRVTTRRMVTSPQVTHALVLGSCSADGDPGRVLWRLDRHASHDLLLYVVSHGKPDFTGVVEQAGWPERPAWRTASYSGFLDHLAEGQEWVFRLTANPSRSESTGDPQQRGRVRPLRTAPEQLDWLNQRQSRLGIEFCRNEIGEPQLELRERDQVSFRRTDKSSRSGTVHLTTATFEGRLRVLEPCRLSAALVEGIGRAKGYGCGLMTLAAVPTAVG